MAASLEELLRGLEGLRDEVRQKLSGNPDPRAVEALRLQALGRRGRLNEYFSKLSEPQWSSEERSALGQRLNAVKKELARLFDERLTQRPGALKGLKLDLTLPGLCPPAGRLHPLTQTTDQITAIFRGLGFSAVEGPEIETEENNFEALNIPADHPSRESFDTLKGSPREAKKAAAFSLVSSERSKGRFACTILAISASMAARSSSASGRSVSTS